MYQVRLLYDNKREKSYYDSYTESTNEKIGNIVCSELPMYQDINRARSCYWDSENEKWIFDNDKYLEIIAEIESARKRQEEKEQLSTIMTNKELTEAVMELAGMIGKIIEKVPIEE